LKILALILINEINLFYINWVDQPLGLSPHSLPNLSFKKRETW